MTENKVKQYHVFYHTPKTLGEITITQDKYTPITSAVLDDAIAAWNRRYDYDEDDGR